MSPASSLPKLKRSETLDVMAYNHIKEAILNGVFSPGEFLAEVQVAQELGISKTPVRKAMGRLQQERFLVSIPFEGYYVAEISVQDIVEIYQLRQILECYLVRETALRFSAEDLAALESMLGEADLALASGDHVRFVEINRQFHHSFDQKHGNLRISDVLTNLDEHVQRILIHEFSDQQMDLATSHQEHYAIVGAIQARDVDRAVRLMGQHLAGFCNLLVARKALKPDGEA